MSNSSVSTLQEFLNTNPIDNLTDEVIISDRFRDNEGSLLKFKIKAMTSGVFEEYRKKSMSINPKSKQKVELDMKKFNSQIVINQTIEPNFKDAESIRALGCTTPDEYLSRVLLPGEIVELSDQIQKLSGFNKDMEELIEEAKN